MTGYGQAHWEGNGRVVVVEVRSVNGRYFKLNARVPHEFGACEQQFETRVREHITRGSVDLFVKVELTGAQAARPVNREALASYVRQFRQVGDELGVPVTLSPDALAALPGVLESDELSEAQAKALLGPITATLDAALGQLDGMRAAEGANLKAEFLRHCEAICGLLDQVEQAYPAMMQEHKRRLLDRVNRLLQETGLTVGEQDMARELAIYADRSSVAEEIARVRSHVEQLREALGQDEPVGRRLEFISQELHREVNTMSAKAAGAALSRHLVALHGEVDKIREQVLNVE